MKKILRLAVVVILIIVVGSFAVSLPHAQPTPEILWDYCMVSACGNDLDEHYEFGVNRYEFTVVEVLPGSEANNTIYVANYDSGENFTKNLSNGEKVFVRWDSYTPIRNDIIPAEESGHYTFFFEGTAMVLINSVDIPEFPTFLVIPMFITASLLAIFYRKKQIK